MLYPELHIAETAGWRALLTHAQAAAELQLTPAVEEHLIAMLFRNVGQDSACSPAGDGTLDDLDRILSADTSDPVLVGDQCLLAAGLFPDQAIQRAIPLPYFVQVGRNAYREYASRKSSILHAILSEEFVLAMDTLQTLRLLQSGEPCIDGLNAYHLWADLGSAHGWRVLRAMTGALPAPGNAAGHVH